MADALYGPAQARKHTNGAHDWLDPKSSVLQFKADPQHPGYQVVGLPLRVSQRPGQRATGPVLVARTKACATHRARMHHDGPETRTLLRIWRSERRL